MVSSPPERDSIDPENDQDVQRMLRWLRLAADVLERDGGGKKGGEREDEKPDEASDRS